MTYEEACAAFREHKKVIVHHNPAYDWTYIPDACERRKKYDGKKGQLIDHSNAHGTCFRVRFGAHGAAWYESEELTLS